MTRPDPHPVEVMVLAGLLTVEAVLTVLRILLVPLLALLLVLVMPRRCAAAPVPAPASAEAPLAPVAAPCLSGLAESLLALPAAQLRELAGTRRRLPKRELVAQLVAMPI